MIMKSTLAVVSPGLQQHLSPAPAHVSTGNFWPSAAPLVATQVPCLHQQPMSPRHSRSQHASSCPSKVHITDQHFKALGPCFCLCYAMHPESCTTKQHSYLPTKDEHYKKGSWGKHSSLGAFVGLTPLVSRSDVSMSAGVNFPDYGSQ